jgi:hypothetical protein
MCEHSEQAPPLQLSHTQHLLRLLHRLTQGQLLLLHFSYELLLLPLLFLHCQLVSGYGNLLPLLPLLLLPLCLQYPCRLAVAAAAAAAQLLVG